MVLIFIEPWKVNTALKNLTKFILKFADKIVGVIIIALFFILFVIGAFTVWDACILDTKASTKTWEAYKPTAKETVSFEDLVSQNSDVKAWLTLYGTNIDYPVLYSSDENYYLFRDALGKSSSSGSIFIDCQCNPDFSDSVTVVYGHHMEANKMFGDIDLFSNRNFFDTHKYGNIFYGQKHHGLQIVGFIETTAYDMSIYKSGHFEASNLPTYIQNLKSKSSCWRDINYNSNSKFLIMSTCSSDRTNGRSVLVALITDDVYENTFGEIANTGIGIQDLEGLFGFPWIGWFCLGAAFILLLVFIFRFIDRKKKQ